MQLVSRGLATDHTKSNLDELKPKKRSKKQQEQEQESEAASPKDKKPK